MLNRGLWGVVLIVVASFVTSGCNSTMLSVAGGAVFGASRVLGDMVGGKSFKDSVSDAAASALEDKVKEKTLGSNTGIMSGIINSRVSDVKNNTGGIKPSEEAFRQLNQNASARKEPKSMDLGDGIILTPEDSKAEAKNDKKTVAMNVVPIEAEKTSTAEKELMAEIDKDIKKSEALETAAK